VAPEPEAKNDGFSLYFWLIPGPFRHVPFSGSNPAVNGAEAGFQLAASSFEQAVESAVPQGRDERQHARDPVRLCQSADRFSR
jgi:hypothetical protein